MAQGVVIRFKADSTEYDAKLKRSIEQMKSMENQAKKLQGSIDRTDEGYVKFVQSLGQMETVSSSVTGRLSELKKAFTELSVQYKNLTDAEKKAPYGKALAGSLEQLKGRIKLTEGDLKSVSQELGGGGLSKVMETLGSKIGIPAGAFTALGGAMAAGAAAAKVAKDAFLATEGGMDTWGAAVESAKGAYSVFLNTLNNGNWSSFFTNLGDAITGANKLYDAMDRLGSIKQNNMAAIAKEQATIQELRLRQEKGENVTKELAAAEERLKNLQMESVNQGKVAGAEQIRQVLTNSVNSMGNGGLFRRDRTAKVSETDIDAAIEDILANGQAAMDKYAEQYSQLSQKALKTITQVNYSPGGVASYETTRTEFDWSALTAEEQALYKLSKAITDSEGNLAAGIQTYATALQEGASANREARKTETAVNKQKTEEAKPQTQAEEKVKKALEDYAASLNIAAIRKEAGLDDEEKYKSNELAAHERLFDAYTDAYNLYADPKYKEAFDKEASEILALAQTVKELKDAKEASKEAEREAAQAIKDALRQQKQLDNSILSGLTGKAKKAGWNAEELGVSGMKTKIEAGIDITEDEWKAVQNRLNERLKSLGLDPIQINFETGNIEEVFDEIKTQMDALKESMSKLSSGVGAISTIGNAFNELKGIGEDLASAFSGEMDAWDSLMTVFNSGIGIMQTVIGVMEAINTLQELSAALSKKKVVEQAAETTAVVAGKGAEAAAEATEAAASGTATVANTAEAASGAGAAMAGIPIVGPVLAIAAIAAVLAAVLAATSKAKSAGNFATGGVVGGSSYSGDRLMAYVNSGETILNPQQTDKVMNGIEGSAGSQRVVVKGRISGKDILLSANNTNRAAGGSRGYYTKVK